MKKIEANDIEAQSADILAHNLSQLNALFPEAFADGRIQFETLRQLLGGAVDESEEKYGLNWHGKRLARQISLTPSTGTLRPCPDESTEWDSTQNLMIEGDNLEVLKLLQKSYAGKVKLIYIDPPYNTGNDFVYPDNFRNGIANYLELTGQADGGVKMATNTETSGRFHTDWLNMMYPRLRLSRSLLSPDGVIFVSCDDNEVQRLRDLLDEIFGEDNFFSQIIVQSNKRGQTYKDIAKTHEYLLVYGRSEETTLFELAKEGGSLPYEDKLGKFDLWELRNRNPKFGRHNRANLYFPIYVSPTDKDSNGYSKISLEKSERFNVEVTPKNSEGKDGCWRWSKQKILAEDCTSECAVVVGRQKRDGEWNIYEKSRKSTTKAKSLWDETGVISEQGTIELGNLGLKGAFDHPKPLALMEKIVSIGMGENDLALDFFAGSGTTAHAIMAKNANDHGTRRFIMVQLPEPLEVKNKEQEQAISYCEKLGKPKNIAELTKERLRRAGAKIREECPMFSGDNGFRVFRLDESNIRVWSPDASNLAETLLDHHEHILDGRTEADIVYELLLKLGLDLCVPIDSRAIAGKTVGAVGRGVLMLCLAETIAAEEVEALAAGIVAWHKELAPAGDSTVVFRDSAFADDVAKTNMAAILAQNGLENVRSL